MTEITYHRAHEPYIEAVADALTAAGVHVESWHGNPDDPRNGAIVLRDDEDGDEAVMWTEESGWYHGTGTGDGVMNDLTWICSEVLPEPAAVVLALQPVLNGDLAGASIRQPRYRDFEDEEDGFEAALAAYHPGGSDR